MSERNSHLVDVLLSLGAIVYVETNVPQTLATVDSDNNIFGRTVNPWNTMLGAGGSSGGEGALVALYGSPLGVGTDVGGSIRIPSLCCGTYGFKPTASRVPRDLPDPPETQLRIDVLPEDPRFPLHPTVKHTMNEAVRRLRAQCHTIIPLDVQKCYIADATETAWEFFMINDAAYKHVAAGEEPLVPSVICTHEIARNLEYRFIPDVNDRDRLSQLAVFRTMRALIIDGWGRIWVDHKLDLVLAPSAQSTAVKHDKVGLPAYTTLTNVLDYPSCVIPFLRAETKACPDDIEIRPGQNVPEYGPDDVEGAPTSVQVFTRGMRDEECLHLGYYILCLTVDYPSRQHSNYARAEPRVKKEKEIDMEKLYGV
ncbi:hypothetical protein RU639_004614 [Aspergillus parasiticus]